MYYYGARYYDPRIIIFVSVDPLAEKTFEPYLYTGNKAIMFTDPTGMSKEQWPPKFIKKWNQLNNKEKEIIKKDPNFFKVGPVETNANLSFEMTDKIFGRQGKGDESDAFRHAFWQALNTQSVGESFTRKWSDAHEYVTPMNEIRTDLYMDIHNNDVGIQIGLDNPDATPTEIRDIVLQKISDGELLIINENNKLTKSDGSLVKNSEIRKIDTAKKIATEIANDPKNQTSQDYE